MTIIDLVNGNIEDIKEVIERNKRSFLKKEGEDGR